MFIVVFGVVVLGVVVVGVFVIVIVRNVYIFCLENGYIFVVFMCLYYCLIGSMGLGKVCICDDDVRGVRR